MVVIGIDPGNVYSAFAVYNSDEHMVEAMAKLPNHDVLAWLREAPEVQYADAVGIEQIRSYGMAVGATVFDTVHWSGRFHQLLLEISGTEVFMVPRSDVKMNICHSMRANDANIRQAIADRFGGMKVCKGTKKDPGPLYGIAGDMWAALGVALTVADNFNEYERVE